MDISKNNIGKIALGVFFIHPFASFLIALNNLKSKRSFTVIFLFFVLFGYTFIATNESADSFHYINEFKDYTRNPSFNLSNDLKEYFTFDSYIKDIYTIITYYLISSFTDNYHLLMALWAAVFSYFFLKSFRFFVEREEFRTSLITALLAFLFIFSNNIFNINGVRFNTAAWVAVYSVFEIVINKKYKYFILALVTPLVHITYISFVVVLILYIFLSKLEKGWIFLFIISFFISEITVNLVQTYQMQLPPALQSMIWSYASEDNLQQRYQIVESLPQYAKFLNALPRYFIQLLMIFFIFNSKKIKKKEESKSVYLFLLIWLSFCNFTMAIPSFGNRFLMLSAPFICYLILLTYRNIPKLRYFVYAIPFVYSYPLLYWARNMVTVSDPFLFTSVFPHILLKNLF